jgi:hypothetical protein
MDKNKVPPEFLAATPDQLRQHHVSREEMDDEEMDQHPNPSSRAASYIESEDRSDEEVLVIILNGRKSMFYQV